MKKILIVFIAVVAVILALFFLSSNKKGVVKSDLKTIENKEPEKMPLKEILVGIYDPHENPDTFTKLLEKRFQELHFTTVIISSLPDAGTANQENIVILYRADTEGLVESFTKQALQTQVYRKGRNEAIQQDIVISSWNIEDVSWGNMDEEAKKLLNPLPEEVKIEVMNATEIAGLAKNLQEDLKKAGYIQASAINIDEKSVEKETENIIYYKRNYKNTAKKISIFLTEKGIRDVSYRSRLGQEVPIVIILGMAQEN